MRTKNVDSFSKGEESYNSLLIRFIFILLLMKSNENKSNIFFEVVVHLGLSNSVQFTYMFALAIVSLIVVKKFCFCHF